MSEFSAQSVENVSDVGSGAETFMFQAEINQLMSLIINAFYSNKEIFLRELVANASDAIDKYRFHLIGKENAIHELQNTEIKIESNKDLKQLIVQDNGIGMSRQEMIDHLGTIAKSGTKQFMQAMQEQKDFSLIGQFGVGFYSAYLVADKVTVVSRGVDADETYVWESDAGGSFTIRVAPDEWKLTRGTRIILTMKEDQLEFLEDHKIRETISKHSSFINYPIQLLTRLTKEVEIPDVETEEADVVDREEKNKEVEEGAVEEDAGDDNGAEKVKPRKTRVENYTEWQQLNKQKPIWTRRPEDVKQEEYNEFYRAVCNDWEDPLATKHFKVEGQMEFSGIVFVPKRAPFDMFGREKKNNIKLYVRRVFITDKSEDLIPEWLTFVRGIVDSDDLPLNVSREMLQQNRIMKIIQKNIVKKCIETFNEMAKEKPEDYKTFYDNFHKNIKLGVYDDDNNRDKLVDLLRFYSTKSGEDRTSLDDYVTRMKEGQKNIYYITGESIAQVKNSPFLEKLRKKGYEVLYLVDTIDEYMTQRLKEYKEKKMVCITKEGALMDDEDEEAKKALEEEYKATCEKMKEILGTRVENVKVSDRITDSPAVLVSGEYGWSANMERIMKAQALQNSQMQMYMSSKKIMEINPHHKLIKSLKDRFADDAQKDSSATKDVVNVLFETSLINSGFGMDDPSQFIQRVYRMLALGLDLGEDEVNEEVEDETTGPKIVLEDVDVGSSMEQLD